ncbi:uncharacterized protein LOC114962079 [Acropora millepora]|uniref:uncharacterized protein LOC114962079 n=1 Tax=Acropora millepora TaxID=45264 RepID=UPI001CF126E4|nr:uncharacterized protein LOC114962079 [Acropora millepora]
MEYLKLLILFSLLVAVTSSPVSKTRCNNSAWAVSFGYRCRTRSLSRKEWHGGVSDAFRDKAQNDRHFQQAIDSATAADKIISASSARKTPSKYSYADFKAYLDQQY